MLAVFEAVYAGEVCRFSRYMAWPRLGALFTKSPDVVNLIVFLVAHDKKTSESGGQGYLVKSKFSSILSH